MVVQTNKVARRFTLGACALVLALLLAACGSNTSSTGNSHSTTHVTNGNTSSYTLTATPTSSMQTVMKTYVGKGFTIEYPQTWKETASGAEVAFIDPTGSYSMTVGTSANSEGSVTSDQLVNGGMTGARANLKNVETVTVPQTTMLANQSWSQRSLTGTTTVQGQITPVQAVVLATNYPEHTTATKGFIIAYVAVKDKFDEAQTTYFNPMLQSFKFTA
jgi:hypothetical protein